MSSFETTLSTLLADAGKIDWAQDEIRTVVGRIIGFLKSDKKTVPAGFVAQTRRRYGVYLGDTQWSLRHTADGLEMYFDPSATQESYIEHLVAIVGTVPLVHLVEIRKQLPALVEEIIRVAPRIVDEWAELGRVAAALRQ